MNDLLQLQQPVKDGAIRSVNFFNGRLLTGKDLSREQAARAEADRRLGSALGDGVAFGYEVAPYRLPSDPGTPVLEVKPGLAINRRGQALRLTRDARIALVRPFDAVAATCVFTDCMPLTGGTYVAGAGAYVLTVAAAATSEGKAATNGLDPANVRCNADATVEAVQFRLLSLERRHYAELDPGTLRFRNELSYRCFGAGVQPGWFANLLGAPPREDDVMTALRRTGLSDSEVPLCLVWLTGAADLRFVDVWSVRRPLVQQDAYGALGSLVQARRLAVGQAMFLQFQDQIAALAAPQSGLGSITARSHFRYLPPVGIIPVQEEANRTDAAATRFFQGMTYRGPVFINAARLEGLMRESLCYPPVETGSGEPAFDRRGGEMIWLYRIRENRMPATPEPRSYIVFASGHLPYRGNARFDLAYWDYSNYALRT